LTKLCRKNGQQLSVPGLEDLRRAMEENLADWEERVHGESDSPEKDVLLKG